MIEAMAAGCAVVASDTPPVTEVVTDGVNGLLTDFFSPAKIAARVAEVLDRPDDYRDMRVKARQTVLDRYDLRRLLPVQLGLLARLAAGK